MCLRAPRVQASLEAMGIAPRASVCGVLEEKVKEIKDFLTVLAPVRGR